MVGKTSPEIPRSTRDDRMENLHIGLTTLSLLRITLPISGIKHLSISL